ncbi:efflux RND transporter periplasmic adaptor subunit [Chloroflexota bacterium]
MKSKIIIGLTLTVLLLALPVATACSGGGGDEEISQQFVDVTRGDLTIGVTGSGKIEASREVRLTFGSGGKVDTILVNEGDKVKKGDILSELDKSALELALAQSQVAVTQADIALVQAQLALDTSKYNLKNTRDTEDALRLTLLNAQISQDIAEDNLTDAVKSYNWDDFLTIDSELNKARTFYDYAVDGSQQQPDAITGDWESLLERARDRLEAAQADYDNFISGHMNVTISIKKKQVEAAKMAVVQAQKNIDDLGEDIAIQELQGASANQSVMQSQQSIELARQSLNEAQRQLDEATIIAPFDGTIAQVMVKEGDNIPSPSMVPTTIIYLIDPAYMELVVEVDEIDIPLLELDQETVISVDALPDAEWKGTITAIYPVPKEEGGVVLYDVRIALDIPENSRIKVGMSASAEVLIEMRTNVLLVPSRAVTKNDHGNTIVKIVSGEQTEERPVVAGLDDGLKTEIISGVNDGETVMFEIRVKTSSASMF